MVANDSFSHGSFYSLQMRVRARLLQGLARAVLVSSMVWLLLTLTVLPGAFANSSGPQTSLDLRLVSTVPAFQRAINDGVKHVVLTEHISAISAQQEIIGSGVSLDSAIGNIQPDTKSIVGRCEKPPNESPAIAQLQLNEELPPNACVIEVEEDFMELPLRQGRGATELWLHNFYIVTHRPRLTPDDSATTILHKDGALYITNTVFQGRDYFNRAIDMSSSDGGSPLLFVKDSIFSDFRRDHAAAIRGNPNTTITVQSTAFKRLTITPMQKPEEDPIKWARIFGSAVGLFENSLLWLSDVSVEDQIVLGEEAVAKVWSFESEPLEEDAQPGGAIYSTPTLKVWDSSQNETVDTEPANTRPNRFLTGGSILQGIIEEQEQLVARTTNSQAQAAGDSETPLTDRDASSDEVTSDTLSNLGDKSSEGSDSNVLLIVFVTASVAILFLAMVLIGVMIVRKQRRNQRSHTAASMPESGMYGEASHMKDVPRSNRTEPLAGMDTHASSCSSHTSRNTSNAHYAHLGSHHHAMFNSAGSMEPHTSSRSAGERLPSETSGKAQSSTMTVYNMQSKLPRAESHMGPEGIARPNSNNRHQSPHNSSIGSEMTGPVARLFHSHHSVAPDHKSLMGFAGQHHTVSTMTYDATYVPEGLPRPDRPGATLNKELLKSALDHVAYSKELFLGQFELLGEKDRREGGQGVVQFALSRSTGAGVAIKFFWNRNSFDCEERLYSQQMLRGLMPAISLIENNDEGAAMTPEGWKYPPFIVIERGESLDEWQMRIQPDFPTIVQMLLHVTERVHTLHEQGVVHRDLKPGNILWRASVHSWTLIDFGCAAEIGLPARLTFSPVYAPPETLQAFHGGATSIVADASVDIWAIGVMAFELVTHKRAFNALTWPKVDVMLAALGERAYDWESEVGTFKHVPQLRILSKVVHACLQRDPVSRPTAFQLLTMLNSLYDSTTQTGADGEQPKSKLESQE